MQRELAETQKRIAEHELDISAGGGAVKIRINGAGEFLALELDPEFLKEDAQFVSETVLQAVQEAAAKARAYNESEMAKVTSGFNLPGLM